MKKATLILNDVRLKPSQVHKFRGYVGNLFSKYDMVHNHDPKTGKPIYRYPRIQFKLIDGCPAIVAITDEAVRIFSEIFMALDRVQIDEMDIPVREKDLRIGEDAFGFSEEFVAYRFFSPWVALNKKNYDSFQEVAFSGESVQVLKRVLIGNLLSMSKSLDYWLKPDQRLDGNFHVKDHPVRLKGQVFLAFTGKFKVNFNIPDYLGIGKSVSRGFGGVRRVES